MKIGISQIVKDHLSILRDDCNDKISTLDYLLFFGVPLLFGFLTYYLKFEASKDIYNVSITFFGIFVALLLNLQVAAFGIYQRKWGTTSDERSDFVRLEGIATRKILLSEINANISYLILVSCISIVLF